MLLIKQMFSVMFSTSFLSKTARFQRTRESIHANLFSNSHLPNLSFLPSFSFYRATTTSLTPPRILIGCRIEQHFNTSQKICLLEVGKRDGRAFRAETRAIRLPREANRSPAELQIERRATDAPERNPCSSS